MPVELTFEYRHVFNEERPEIKTLLKGISSKFILGLLATINDILRIRGDSVNTQFFILDFLTSSQPGIWRDQLLLKVHYKFRSGYTLFALPYTIEFINRELINFRDINPDSSIDVAADELKILKAYVAIMDEMIQRDTEILQKEREEAAKYGGEYLMTLMWPHLIRQFEFHNSPDIIRETNKGLALMSFLEKHSRFGKYVEEYYGSMGYKSGQEYLFSLVSLIIPHLKREPTNQPFDYFFRISVRDTEPSLEALAVNPQEIASNTDKQIDYRGIKERPLFKWSETDYIVLHWDYLFNALYAGLIFSFYRNSGVSQIVSDLGGFKSIISKEFSENIIFANTLKASFRKADCLAFFDDNLPFNPDCYYRKGNQIFIIEFKDYLLNSEVIQSTSYERIKSAIDEKFVQATKEDKGKIKVKDKGVYQLARNIEYLVDNPLAFWEFDQQAAIRKLELKNMIIYPIIIHTNFYFDFPGINEYLDNKLQERLKTVKSKVQQIKAFTLINNDYFFDRILMFSDGKLSLKSELNYYYQLSIRLQNKAHRTREVNDWFDAFVPFSYVNSDEYKKNYYYRRKEVLDEIQKCWKIDFKKENNSL